MSAEVNKALVRRYLEDALAEVRGGNLDATNEFLTGDATFYDLGQPPSVGTRPSNSAPPCSWGLP